MKWQKLNINMAVTGPLLTRSSDVIPVGIDGQNLVYNGKPVVLGSHIRGHLRHAWEELNKLGADYPIARWLGTESARPTRHSQLLPGRLIAAVCTLHIFFIFLALRHRLAIIFV